MPPKNTLFQKIKQLFASSRSADTAMSTFKWVAIISLAGIFLENIIKRFLQTDLHTTSGYTDKWLIY